MPGDLGVVTGYLFGRGCAGGANNQQARDRSIQQDKPVKSSDNNVPEVVA